MIHEIKNPIINHKLAQLRRKETLSKDFRALVEDIAALLTYEVGKNFKTRTIEIETPILRAGLALANGALNILQSGIQDFIATKKFCIKQKPTRALQCRLIFF